MIAGYETTSVLMSFTFYVLATEPVVQNKVYEEIQQEIGDVNHINVWKEWNLSFSLKGEITYESLGQLRYLDMVINETLRMYPPFIRSVFLGIVVSLINIFVW